MRPVVTGGEALIGAIAEARTDLDPRGSVFIAGEYWDAVVQEGTVQNGEKVRIVARDKLHLTVQRIDSTDQSN